MTCQTKFNQDKTFSNQTKGQQKAERTGKGQEKIRFTKNGERRKEIKREKISEYY